MLQNAGPDARRFAFTAPPKLDNAWNWGGSATMTAFVGPWGTTYAGNLTPDRATGIGTWREADFIKALRTGKHLGATRPILPPMLWQSIGTLPDKDLRAIYAYLMAPPAVKNKVPEYAPPVAPLGKAGEGRRGLEGLLGGYSEVWPR